MTSITRLSMWTKALIAGVVWCIVMTGAAAAQGAAEGTITGTVIDATKAVLPGVTVTATNPTTGFTREAVTDVRGNFILAALPPGTYEVVAALPGFNTFRRSVTVTVGSETSLVIPLSVGGLAETLTVTGEAPLVEVTRTEQGTTLSENEVRNLPINSRNFTDFALLAPGVVPSRTGGATGGVLNAVTKSGTNDFSGYGFFFLRHNAFDKPPFDLETAADGVVTAVPATAADEFQRRVAGFTVGGPLKTNKAFFFGVIDQTNNNTPRVRTIRESTLEAVGRLIPNLPDNESNRVTQFKPTSTKGSVKVDLNFSQQHNASARFSMARNFSPAGTANGRNSVSLGNQSESNYYLASGSLNSFLSDRALNTVRFNFSTNLSTTSYPQRGGIENYLNMDPGIVIGGGAGGTFGGGASANISPRTIETKYEVQDTATLYRDKHTVKFGGYFQAVPFYQSFMFYTLGLWNFSDINAFNAGVPSMFRQAFGPAASYMVTQMWAGFAQDEWQPTSNLTINYGLRYEIQRHPDVSDFELPEPGLNPTTGRFDVTRNGSPYIGKFKNDSNNVMPSARDVTWRRARF